MNKVIADIISDYGTDHLRDLISELEEKIQYKKNEEKILIWRVTDRYLCRGNFPASDYLEAVDCLAKYARKSWAECNKEVITYDNLPGSLTVAIEAEFIPKSEISEYLK
ncbi:hypothetical protein E6W93_22540 [Salmonella enterica subsp. enterica serovar Uppsala]|nr:hypothetical protein [Salmonella enterica subsp. enterica serovar Uppsala]